MSKMEKLQKQIVQKSRGMHADDVIMALLAVSTRVVVTNPDREQSTFLLAMIEFWARSAREMISTNDIEMGIAHGLVVEAIRDRLIFSAK